MNFCISGVAASANAGPCWESQADSAMPDAAGRTAIGPKPACDNVQQTLYCPPIRKALFLPHVQARTQVHSAGLCARAEGSLSTLPNDLHPHVRVKHVPAWGDLADPPVRGQAEQGLSLPTTTELSGQGTHLDGLHTKHGSKSSDQSPPSEAQAATANRDDFAEVFAFL